MSEEAKTLTAKEKAWADAYIVTLSKAGAARIAKYKGDNKTLAHVGWENYRKEHIQAYMKDKIEKMAMPANEVIARLGAIAGSSIADFADIQSLDDLAEHPGAMAVKKFKRRITTDQLNRQREEIELELYPADISLERIGKHLGLLTDRHIVDVRLEKEVEQILNILEEMLPPDDYQRILARLGSGPVSQAETTEPDNSELAG